MRLALARWAFTSSRRIHASLRPDTSGWSTSRRRPGTSGWSTSRRSSQPPTSKVWVVDFEAVFPAANVTVWVVDFEATTRHVWVVDFEAVFPAANVTQDVSLVFTAFVTKDARQARRSVTARVWSMQLDKSALNSIDDLLAKGDVNSALLVIDIVAGGLNGRQSQVRHACLIIVVERTIPRSRLLGSRNFPSSNSYIGHANS